MSYQSHKHHAAANFVKRLCESIILSKLNFIGRFKVFRMLFHGFRNTCSVVSYLWPYTSSWVFIPCRCTVIAANNTTTVTATASIAFLCIFFPPDFFLITICQICRQNFADFLKKKQIFKKCSNVIPLYEARGAKSARCVSLRDKNRGFDSRLPLRWARI